MPDVNDNQVVIGGRAPDSWCRPCQTRPVSDSRRLVAKLVAGSNVLRDAGVNMYEYTEQLTYLLFLKMAEERATRPLNAEQVVPDEFSWHQCSGCRGGARGHLQPHPARPREPARRARRDLPRRAEQDLEPIAPQDADRRLHRQGELVGGRRRRQRRRLRGTARAQRRRHEVDRRPVLHATRTDPGDGRGRPADDRRPGGRSGVRHRRVPACRPRARLTRRRRLHPAAARAPADAGSSPASTSARRRRGWRR